MKRRHEVAVNYVKAEPGELEPFPHGVDLIAPVRGQWPVKVGVSWDPVKRLNTLQTSHWERLRVLRFWYCRSRPAAFRLEKRAHEILSVRLLLGEWFDIDVSAAEKVIKRAAEEESIAIREMSGGKRFEKHADKFLKSQPENSLPQFGQISIVSK